MNDKNNRKYEININDVKHLLGWVLEDIPVKKEIKKEELNIDALLDEYNDYMTLFKMFGDNEYKLKANTIMNTLKVA